MSLKFRNIILAYLILFSNVLAQERLELVVDKKLTLEKVFAAGFRPSSVQPSNQADVRVWERNEVILVFGDFRYDLNIEQATFGVYDDDQISFLRFVTTSEKPLTVEEATAEVKRFSAGLGMNLDEHIEMWRKKCEARKSMAMGGFGGYDWMEGVNIGGEFLTTLQQLDKFPVVLAFEIRWKYLGKDSSFPTSGRGSRKTAIVSPPGYEWDMSFQAWSKRTREGKAGNRTTNIPRERLGFAISENLPNVEKIKAEPLKKELQEPQLKEKSQPGKNNLLVWVLGGLLILGLGIYGIRNRSSS